MGEERGTTNAKTINDNRGRREREHKDLVLVKLPDRSGVIGHGGLQHCVGKGEVSNPS